ncbi:MAG: RpiB/LacA/LacB family sugar-phosphate isomerase [Chloroflexi bacterium]|nr:RpiB/LacA/LacB family sugar-phosphate isomerase [Chloroflexota bacterium]
MKLAVGSDEKTHLTGHVIAELEKRGHTVERFGPLRGEASNENRSLNWAQVAQAVAEAVAEQRADEGILFCWTGTGVALAANKVPGIRAALCHDAETAKGARLWNHANVLCLSLRATSETVAQEILDAWFNTPLGTDPSDVLAVEQVGEIERKYGSK